MQRERIDLVAGARIDFADDRIVPGNEAVGMAGQPLDGFPTWYGFLAPAGTPKEVITRLESEMLAIMKDPAVIERMQSVGNEVLLTGAEAFGKENEIEIETLGRAVKETNVVIAQ